MIKSETSRPATGNSTRRSPTESRIDKVAVAENVESGTVSATVTALVTFDVKGDPETAGDHYDATTAPVKAAQAANPQFEIRQFGDASSMKELDDAFMKDLQKAETLSRR